MLYIGIDLGTSSVKMIIVDEKGYIKRIVSREYPLYFPHTGWSEQNPEDWLKETKKGLKELVEGFDTSEIKGMSFGGQMHGLVALDKDDEVIRPAILWNDGRTSKENDYLNIKIGRNRLSELTGNISFTGFTASKILWMKNNEPENFSRIAKVMLPKDYLAYMFTGVNSTDVSDASGTLLFDVKKRCWSKEMCEICGLDMNVLPQIFESYEKIGNLRKEIASELGLNEIVVAAGAGDNAAAAIGTGTVGNDNCNISLGTSGTVFISEDEYRRDESFALHSFDDANGKYHLMGCMLSAASSNMWWCDKILGDSDYAAIQSKIKNPGENNVFYLPYLMGER
ncbi:MAG: xylulokinase, partial [Lachnospiraceae bacterium]|nr:xylulokinase [Lachnospiraceae bacterium]